MAVVECNANAVQTGTLEECSIGILEEVFEELVEMTGSVHAAEDET
jgi:hypothetical protein